MKKVILIVFILWIFIVLTVGYINRKSHSVSLREHAINSFAGCYSPSKRSAQSYEKMTQEEIEQTLKTLDLSKEEFERRKAECNKD